MLINLFKQSLLTNSINRFNAIKCVYLFSMQSNKDLVPPDHVRFMKVLDSEKFSKEVTVSCLNITDIKLSLVIKTLKKYLLKLERFKPVINNGEKTTTILLNPGIVNKWGDFSEEDQTYFRSLELTEKCFDKKTITLKYDNYKVEDIFRSVLPEDKEGMASYTKVGHITHVNLREHLLPYKEFIGQVLLDKVHGCKTVVNKSSNIDNTYRNFEMELLCGKNDFMATLKENTCTFQFDFSKVYWNSRLSTEHERIVDKIDKNDVLFDVFAGVGPFSIPVAKKAYKVYANDLNPESFKYLNKNIIANKIKPNIITTSNKDGKEFILTDVRNNLLQYNNKKIHIVMNLPAMAVEFISAFKKLFKDNELDSLEHFPILYLYCFAKGEDYTTIAKSLVIENIGFDISDKILEIFKVRTVSSLKEMMRVTIRLDKEILGGRNDDKRVLEDKIDCQPTKKSK